MDAIAGQGLAIGLELGRLVLGLVAVLCLRALREGREVKLRFKIPSFSLNLRVPPREVPETQAPPQGTGPADDDLHHGARERKPFLEKTCDNQQQVDSRGIF